MKKENLHELAADFFERNARVNKVFFSTDGQAFLEEAHAKNHATAKDLEVESFSRKDAQGKELAAKLSPEAKLKLLEAKLVESDDKLKAATAQIAVLQAKNAAGEAQLKEAEVKLIEAEKATKDLQAKLKELEAKIVTQEKATK